MPILLAPTANLARELLATRYVALTVEAEYGAYVAEGLVYTAAHHQATGDYAGRHIVAGGRAAPCNDEDIPQISVASDLVLVSHIDLDTIGGCLRALPEFQGLFPPWLTARNGDFWSLAEFVDVHGAHKLGGSGADFRAVRQLHAFWAWLKGCPRAPRDVVTDITAIVQEAGTVLQRIFADDAELLARGDALRAAEADLNTRSFVRQDDDVIVRIVDTSREFCNHLYATPEGAVGRAIASYCRETGMVTISLADPVPGVSCRAIVQDLWGSEAGGHDGIAGSPRGQDMGEIGLMVAVHALTEALRATRP